MKFTIIETCTCEYEVEAETLADAQDLFYEWGPEISVESPVKFLGVTDRQYDPGGDPIQ